MPVVFQHTLMSPIGLTVAPTPPSGVPAFNPPYPRFGFMNTGGNNSSAMTNAQAIRLARGDFTILGLAYTGCGAQTFNGSCNAFVTFIQSNGPSTGCKVFSYILPDTMGTVGRGDYPQVTTKLGANPSWVLKPSGFTGSTVTENYFYGDGSVSNSTTYVTPDSNGLILEDWVMSFYDQYHIQGTFGGSSQSTDVMPTLDGIEHDNFQGQFPNGGYSSANGGTGAADYNGDGNADYQLATSPVAGTVIAQAYRNGLARGVNKWAALEPTKYFIGNIASWGYPDPGGSNGVTSNKTGGTSASYFTGIWNLIHGGFIEGWQGLSWSQNSSIAETQIQLSLANVIAPKLIMPAVYWNTSGESAANTSTAWQSARYQYCFAHQDNTFPLICSSIGDPSPSYNANQATWLDEFTVNPITGVATGESNSYAGKGYAGYPTNSSWTVDSSTGIFYRTFLNATTGIAWIFLTNKIGNGSETFNCFSILGKHFQAITGTQSPSINNGGTLASVNMSDGSGQVGMLVT